MSDDIIVVSQVGIKSDQITHFVPESSKYVSKTNMQCFVSDLLSKRNPAKARRGEEGETQVLLCAFYQKGIKVSLSTGSLPQTRLYSPCLP